MNEPTIAKLQAAWNGWHIWRGHPSDDPNGGVRAGDWVATRVEAMAGVDRTLTADSADLLDLELHRQAAMAEAVQQLVERLNSRRIHTEMDGPKVRVTDLASGRCETVVVAYVEHRIALVWSWRYEDGDEIIGRADDPTAVTQSVAEKLSQPRPTPPAGGVWPGDRP